MEDVSMEYKILKIRLERELILKRREEVTECITRNTFMYKALFIGAVVMFILAIGRHNEVGPWISANYLLFMATNGVLSTGLLSIVKVYRVELDHLNQQLGVIDNEEPMQDV